MLVRCESNLIYEIPMSPELRRDIQSSFRTPDGRVHLDVGKAYVVYALTIRGNCLWYYLADEAFTQYPVAYPAALFSIIDGRVSRHWQIEFDAQRAFTLITFAGWLGNELFLENLVNGVPETVNFFMRSKKAFDREFPNPQITRLAGLIERNWLSCPQCGNVWEVSEQGLLDALAECPSCSTILRRPEQCVSVR